MCPAVQSDTACLPKVRQIRMHPAGRSKPLPYVPTNTTSVEMTFIGHLICEHNAYYGWHENDQCKGLACPAGNTMTVHNFEGEASEKITAIHEFGHMFGIEDHYGTNDNPQDNTKMKSTYAMRQIDREYSSACIYGEEKNLDSTINGILICRGCQNRIEDNLYKYS